MFGMFKKSNIVKGDRGEDLPLTHDGMPDSYIPNGLCPRCGKQSSFESIGNLPVTFDGGRTYSSGNGKSYPTHSDRVTCMICRHCNQGIVVIEEERIGYRPTRLGLESGEVNFHGIHWWPLPNSRISSDVPSEISDIFGEAVTTYYANAPRATAVMLRRTIEAITVHFGEDKGTLAQRLQNLGNKNVLQPALSDWSKEVRLIGNQGAHYDPANIVTMEDAKQLLTFVQDLMKYLFELPAQLEKRRNQ